MPSISLFHTPLSRGACHQNTTDLPRDSQSPASCTQAPQELYGHHTIRRRYFSTFTPLPLLSCKLQSKLDFSCPSFRRAHRPFLPLLYVGQWQVSTDRLQAKSSGAKKIMPKNFEDLLHMENMLYFLGDQEDEKTPKQYLNQVCHLNKFYLILK